MVSGLFLSKDIVYQNGKPAYLVDLSKGLSLIHISMCIRDRKYTRAVDKLKEEAINSLPELKF